MTQEQQYQPKINFQDVMWVHDVKIQNDFDLAVVTVKVYNGKNKDGSYKEPGYLDVQCWGDLGKIVKSPTSGIQKGAKVAFQGRFGTRSYTDKTGAKRTQYFVNASAIKAVVDQQRG